MAVAVALMLVPELALAQVDAGGAWFARSGECMDTGFVDTAAFSALGQHGYSFSAPPEAKAEVAPCQNDLLDADPQHNVCFEGNPAPISTLPRLLAKLQADRASALVLETIYSFSRDDELAQTPDPSLGEQRAVPLDNGATCSSDGDQCRSLPPLPGMISVAGLIPALEHQPDALDTPPAYVVEVEPQPLWARLRVGPSDDHRFPPHRPPIAA
ncbi:MAG: hypothetical protein H0U74_04365 [Bradymonadaceae bacterium]|nr:hypothetical protein [Lujinxingiaceae bacterium]